jgi:hypothetical protein
MREEGGLSGTNRRRDGSRGGRTNKATLSGIHAVHRNRNLRWSIRLGQRTAHIHRHTRLVNGDGREEGVCASRKAYDWLMVKGRVGSGRVGGPSIHSL